MAKLQTYLIQSESCSKSVLPGSFTILIDDELLPSILFTLRSLMDTLSRQVNTNQQNIDNVMLTLVLYSTSAKLRSSLNQKAAMINKLRDQSSNLRTSQSFKQNSRCFETCIKFTPMFLPSYFFWSDIQSTGVLRYISD